MFPNQVKIGTCILAQDGQWFDVGYGLPVCGSFRSDKLPYIQQHLGAFATWQDCDSNTNFTKTKVTKLKSIRDYRDMLLLCILYFLQLKNNNVNVCDAEHHYNRVTRTHSLFQKAYRRLLQQGLIISF